MTLCTVKKSHIWNLQGSFNINCTYQYSFKLSHIQLDGRRFIRAIAPRAHTFYRHLNTIFLSWVVRAFVTLTHGTLFSRHRRVALRSDLSTLTAQCEVLPGHYSFCLQTLHFLLTLLNVNQQDASRRDATRRATLVVADWVLCASCDCGAQLIATYPICPN